MKLNSLPQPVAIRLLDLDQRASDLVAIADKADAALAYARDVINGRRECGKEEYEQHRDSFDAINAQAKATRARSELERGILRDARAWIEGLGQSVKLCTVAQVSSDLDVASAKAKLAAMRAELQSLSLVTVPADDIAERVQAYVQSLAAKAKPMVRGYGANQPLDVRWPNALDANAMNGSGYNSSGSALFLAALLMPDALTDSITRAIEATMPLPKAELERRKLELPKAIDEWSYVVAAMIDKAGAAPDPMMAPQHHLGVRIVVNGEDDEARPSRRVRASPQDQPSA